MPLYLSCFFGFGLGAGHGDEAGFQTVQMPCAPGAMQTQKAHMAK
jgi:hypothetical protein